MDINLKEEFKQLQERLKKSPERMDEYLKQCITFVSNDEVDNSGIKTDIIDIKRDEVLMWLELISNPVFDKLNYIPKKAYDFYIAHRLIKDIKYINTLVDVGGQSPCLLKALSCSRIVERRILVDICVHAGDDIEVIEASGAKIPLGEESCDVITCLHSIEHFQNNDDFHFISEVGRLLKPEGVALILPLFLTTTDVFSYNIKSYFEKSKYAGKIYDPYGGFPGWGYGEGYSRTYTLPSFVDGLMSQLSESCHLKLIHITFDGEVAPIKDFPNYQGNTFEYPYRALYITKKQIYGN